MSYGEVFVAVSSTFTEAIVIAHPSQINQVGNYLLFNGAKPASKNGDTINYLLVMVASSYTGENGLMDIVDEMRKRITTSPFAFSLVSVRRAELNAPTLYSVAMEIAIGATFD